MKRCIALVIAISCLGLAPQALAARAPAELSTPVVNGPDLTKFFDGTVTTPKPEACADTREILLERQKSNGKFKTRYRSNVFADPMDPEQWVYRITVVDPPDGTYRVRMEKTKRCKPAKSGTVTYVSF